MNEQTKAIRYSVLIAIDVDGSRAPLVAELRSAISDIDVVYFKVSEVWHVMDLQTVMFEFVTPGPIGDEHVNKIRDIFNRYNKFNDDRDTDIGLSYGSQEDYQSREDRHSMEQMKTSWLKELREQHKDLSAVIKVLEQKTPAEVPF